MFTQRIDQRDHQPTSAAGIACPLDEARGPLIERQQMAAVLLRQGLEQGRHLVGQHAGHQPFGPHCIDLIERKERHSQGHAIVVGAGLEVVGRLKRHTAHAQTLRELAVVDAVGLLAHQQFARQLEQIRLSATGASPPALELLAAGDLGRHLRIEPVEEKLLVDQQIGSADTRFELPDLGHHFQVVTKKSTVGVPLACDQRFTDQQFARQPRVDAAIGSTPLGIDHQTVDRAALEGDRLPGAPLPVRLAPAALDEMRGGLLDPDRIEAGHGAAVEAAGVDHLGGHHPATAAGGLGARGGGGGLLGRALRRTATRQPRAGMQKEPGRMGAQVVGLVGCAASEVAKQTGQQRTMQGLIARRLLIGQPLHRTDRLKQLGMDIGPFPKLARRQKFALQALRECAARFAGWAAGLLLRLPPVPEFHVAQKIGARIDEAGMRLIGGLLTIERAFTGILGGKRRRDDECLAQAAALVSGEQYACDARIDRQSRELVAGGGELALLIDGVELAKQIKPIEHRTPWWRIDKGEGLDVFEPQRLHPKDDRGQRGAQDFGVGEGRALDEIGLIVEAYADAVGHPSTATCALIGGRTRYRLDLQLFDLAAIAIALDPGHAGIDDIADAGHGERGLGDIGRQHHARRIAGGKHALLVGGRQTRKKAQDLGRRHQPAARSAPCPGTSKVVGRLTDLALARQEDQDIAGPLAPEFVDRRLDCSGGVGLVVVIPATGATGAAGRRPRGRRDRWHGGRWCRP